MKIINPSLFISTLLILLGASAEGKFRRLDDIEFIAADPGMKNSNRSVGSGAAGWGRWREDPGPRGVELKDFGKLQANGRLAPAGWKLDPNDWWMDENGLIMEQPEFPLPPGAYQLEWLNNAPLNRDNAILSVHSYRSQWELSDNATLSSVTHRPCRSARYTGCPPSAASMKDFPVAPGAVMPDVPGCNKQDYAVLFIVGVEK